MNFTWKHRIVVSLAAVAVIGAGIYAGTRPFSVSHAPTKLAVAADPPPPPPPAGKTFSEDGCSGTAGQETLLTGASFSAGTYSITYGDETNWSCYTWVVNGSVVPPNQPPPSDTTKATFTYTDANTNDTVSFFVVDGDHGGNWDMFTWNGTTPASSGTVTFAPGCSASAGTENLISNTSAYAAPEPGGVGVNATYQDETVLHCYEWQVNGTLVPPDCNVSQPNSTNETLCYTFTPAEGFVHTISLDVVDMDHGGNWDQFTWTPPACYPPGPSQLVNVTANKGTVAGTLEDRCGTPVGAGHQVTEQAGSSTKTAPTNGQGHFQFPPWPPSTPSPATVQFKGDSTVLASNTVSCTLPNDAHCS